MGYRVVRTAEHEWIERPTEGQASRHVADLTVPAALAESRARLWRLPPGTRGRRHRELVQEEVFVVLEGTLTMLLGDPPERFDLPPQSVVSVEPRARPSRCGTRATPRSCVFAYGAPPVTGQAEYLDDVEL